MKKLVLLFVMALAVSSAFSQSENYKPFKVDAGFLYAIPGGDGVKSGAGFYLEPKYNINDNIALGLKLEVAVMGASDDLGTDVSITALKTYQLTGDYYFNQNRVRPFAGLGVGMYSLGSVEVGGVEVADFGTKFGFAPRVGLLIGHFRAGLEYNVITGIESGMESRNYISMKIGFEIGGGKK